MLDYQLRVVEEKAELDKKIEKLEDFLSTLAFDGLRRTNRELLVIQWFTMTQYSEILRQRIALFI